MQRIAIYTGPCIVRAMANNARLLFPNALVAEGTQHIYIFHELDVAAKNTMVEFLAEQPYRWLYRRILKEFRGY